MSEQATLSAKLWSGVSRKKLHFPFEVVQKYGMLPMDQFWGLEGEKTSLEPFFFLNFCPRESSRRNIVFPKVKYPW